MDLICVLFFLESVPLFLWLFILYDAESTTSVPHIEIHFLSLHRFFKTIWELSNSLQLTESS